MTEPTAILVVEDDEPTRTFLADNLTADGYDLLVAADTPFVDAAAGLKDLGVEVTHIEGDLSTV